MKLLNYVDSPLKDWEKPCHLGFLSGSNYRMLKLLIKKSPGVIRTNKFTSLLHFIQQTTPSPPPLLISKNSQTFICIKVYGRNVSTLSSLIFLWEKIFYGLSYLVFWYAFPSSSISWPASCSRDRRSCSTRSRKSSWERLLERRNLLNWVSFTSSAWNTIKY